MQSGKLFIAGMLLLSASCQQIELAEPVRVDERHELNIQGVINQEYVTRADDEGFVNGDRMGVFVVDASLEQSSENAYANNIRYTYDGNTGLWESSSDVYWLDDITPINIYGYYPFTNVVSDIRCYSFEVFSNQGIANNMMSNYEASDFLYASALHVPALTGRVTLMYNHIMAGIKVELVEGDGFSDKDWKSLDKQVAIENVNRHCEINLTDGSVKPIGESDSEIVMGINSDGTYRAVVVPQTVTSDTDIQVAIEGQTYRLKMPENTALLSGKLYHFKITVNRRLGGDYELMLTDNQICPWENDEFSHSFEANSYVVIHNAVKGQLENRMNELELSYSEITKLKITGEINEIDYQFIREKMERLDAINLHDVTSYGVFTNGDIESEVRINMLPNNAFDGMRLLARLILPENLEVIGSSSLSGTSLRGYIHIPNSVTYIGHAAFAFTETSELMSFNIPASLKCIEGSAFFDNKAAFEFILPNTVESIGGSAFMGASNAYGVFSLPTALTYLGESAFNGLGNGMTGDIEIPSNLKKIPFNAFTINFKKGCRLYFHEGVESIAKGAFCYLTINNAVILPNSLTEIGLEDGNGGWDEGAFFGVNFRNGVVLPENLSYIGPQTFGESNISGMPIIPSQILEIPAGLYRGTQISGIEIPETVESISMEAFMRCESLKTATIGKNVTYIGRDAFSECPQLQVVICKAKIPPVADDAFNSLSWDRVILEVPEESISLYRNATGWSNFRAITSHKELSVNIPIVNALNNALSVDGIVRSEGPWSVVETPVWCNMEPLSSEDKKTLVSIQVEELSDGAGSREGKIVLKLNDYDYTVEIPVIQYDYDHKIGEEVVLQNASSGKTPINVFIVGDGFGVDEIIGGQYLELMHEQMEYLFDIEPYRTYRNRFSVSTAITLSSESGITDYTNEVSTQFETSNYLSLDCNKEKLRDFVVRSSSLIDEKNYKDALVIMLANSMGTYGNVPVTEDYSLAICPISDDSYPYDQRGVIQHYAGGQGFGKLGPENIAHSDFISHCQCPYCSDMTTFTRAQELGYYRNLSLSNKISTLPWKHLIFDSRYGKDVDVFEGGYRHARGVWRSESQSCMGTFIPYYNAISRQIIVERILELSGDEFVFEDFVAKDKVDEY